MGLSWSGWLGEILRWFGARNHIHLSISCGGRESNSRPSSRESNDLKAKFHYVILVADLLVRASSLLASYMIGQIPARCRSATSFEPVCDQDSVMEFGFNY